MTDKKRGEREAGSFTELKEVKGEMEGTKAGENGSSGAGCTTREIPAEKENNDPS